MRTSKYKNVKTEYNGIKYDSKKEAEYARQLDIFKHASGKMQVLEIIRQPIFSIIIKGKEVCKYKADFGVKYPDRYEYIDVKGFKTPIYRLKKKLVEAQYGITIKEV